MSLRRLLPVLVFIIPVLCGAYPLHSPTWGFSLDLPPDYEYTGGDGRDRFSFMNPEGACLDIVVYPAEGTGSYSSVRTLAADVQRRIRSTGDTSYFTYRNNEAAILELVFPDPAIAGNVMIGWGLALELPSGNNSSGPLMIALAYSPARRQDLQLLHLSVLDSIAPGRAERLYHGPVTEFSYPRETRRRMPVWGLGESAWFYVEDEEANQALIDREFNVLVRYADSPDWEDAWIRYYRSIYRDSYSRLADTAFLVNKVFNTSPGSDYIFAGKLLDWLQRFRYERDFRGADFVNLVRAVREGSGDCDNKAMLWAIILNHANIEAAIMVSAEYGHAMGLVNVPGEGARFGLAGVQWLVAETTASVGLGLIAEEMSDSNKWLGIILE